MRQIIAAVAVTFYVAIVSAEGGSPVRRPVPIVQIWGRLPRRRTRPVLRYLSLLNG